MSNPKVETSKSVKRAPVLKVRVPQEVIDTSTQKNSSHCMIADTIRKSYPRFTHISVDIQTIRVSDILTNRRYIYLTPPVAQQAIVLFDEGKKMKPFGFNLRGAHIVTRQITNRSKGQPLKRRLSLGRRRILPRTGNDVPDTIGGTPIRKHPSSATGRTFGLRAFTKSDLEDVGVSR